MTEVCEAVLTIRNELGLHARAATAFVQMASRFEADVIVGKGNREVNGKSIMGVLTLVAARNSEIRIRARGSDAKAAVSALSELVANRFGETR